MSAPSTPAPISFPVPARGGTLSAQDQTFQRSPDGDADPGYVRRLITDRPKPYPATTTLTLPEISTAHALLAFNAIRVTRPGTGGPADPAHVRMYERGLIKPVPRTLEPRSCNWTWTSPEARYDATRMIAEIEGNVHWPAHLARRLTFGERRWTPTPAYLLGVLAWHYKPTPVHTLDIIGPHHNPPAPDPTQVVVEHITLVEHHLDGTHHSRTLPVPTSDDPHLHALLDSLEEQAGAVMSWGRVINYESPDYDTARLDDTVLAWFLATLYEHHELDDLNLTDQWFAAHPHLNPTDQRTEWSTIDRLDLSVDLTRWRITPHGYPTDTTFSHAAPPALTDRLTYLGAPTFATADEFVAWAEANLTVSFLCSGKPHEVDTDRGIVSAKVTGARKHTIRVDPHTGTPSPVTPTEKSRHALQANHLMWALHTGRFPTKCDWVTQAMHLLGDARHLTDRSWSTATAERLVAIRTVMRAVQYLAAGLDLSTHAFLLTMAIPSDVVADATEAVTQGRTTWPELHYQFDRLIMDNDSPRHQDAARAVLDWALDPDREVGWRPAD